MNFFKKLGRKTAKVSTKINRVATPLVAAGAGFFGGPVAGAAVTALGAQAGYYFRATQARNEGTFGRDARARGRGERKRVAIYGAIGTGAGALGSFGTALASGSSFSSALGQGAFGQFGAKVILGESALFPKAPGMNIVATQEALWAQKASPVPGIVTQSQFNASLAGGSTPAETAAATAGKAGESSLLAKSLGLVTNVAEKMKIPGTPNGAPPTQPNDSAFLDGLLAGLGIGGSGGGGDSGGGSGGGFMNAPMGDESKLSPAMIAALGVGAFLLLA